MRRIYAAVVILTLLLASGSPLRAEDLGEEGSEYPVFTWAHWHLHHKPSGMTTDQWRAELTSLADAGDPEAQYLVGRLKEAAEGGYVYALEELGLAYFGSGEYAVAFPMLLGSARMGLRGNVTDALAEMYDHGWGTPIDPLKACYWRQYGCGKPKPTGPVIDIISD